MIASLCQVNLTELKVHDIVKMELMCNLMIASLCQVNLTELKVHVVTTEHFLSDVFRKCIKKIIIFQNGLFDVYIPFKNN
jgi:hypothetical protein